MVCLMIGIAQEISAHGKYSRDTGPDSLPQQTCDDLDIIGCDIFLKSGEQIP
jgi:hypothetical protein